MLRFFGLTSSEVRLSVLSKMSRINEMQILNFFFSKYHMLLKPDKLSPLTTSHRPISLMSSITKLFKTMTEQMLRSYLKDTGFMNKYKLGFRWDKPTDDPLFRLSQSVMESFNRKKHVVAVFIDFDKAFDTVWCNGLKYKIFMFDFLTKMTHWLSDS